MWLELRSTFGASVVAAVLPLWAMQGTAPAPQIQNGRVETRATTSIDQAIAGVSGPEPVWAFWRVPILDGERGPCGQWSDDNEPLIRGALLDTGTTGTIVSNNRPQITPPAGPVPLEGGTGLLVLVRVVEGRVERMRTLGDDCPIDANGRTVYSLTGVTPAESLRYLETFTRPDASGDRLSGNAHRELAQAALAAIRRHRDPAADAILDRIATNENDTEMRRQAASALAISRGAHGFATVKRLVETEKNPDLRRSFVTSLGQTRETGTVEAMRGLTRDTDPKIRAEAIYYLALRGGVAVVPEIRTFIEKETDPTVKQRAVRGLARLPVNDAVPLLIQLAQKSTDPVVRKESVSSLGQTRDPRAMAFLEELVKR